MSEWIRCRVAKPPESHSVLLYIVTYHDDGEHVWDDEIMVGFYGSKDWERTGFYIETLHDNKFLEEDKCIKVLAWTLLPRKPYKDILNDDGEWSI